MSTELSKHALLPAGLSDFLPPDAAHEERTVQGFLAVFAGHGYERVKPPLMEFEESLLSGGGAPLSDQTFRLMDPVSQKMMGLRPDMTMQVARIAATRLMGAPRPLRLSYAGEVLRVRGTQLRPERQFGQVGAEIIGSQSPAADIEVIRMAVEALSESGIEGLSVDLALPTLIPALCDAMDVSPASRALLRLALDRKDAAAVEAMGDALGKDAIDIFAALLAASGPVSDAIPALSALDLPPDAARERERLVAVATGMMEPAMGPSVTVDAVENRGWEYHTGVTFTIFARGVRGELGGGGRYAAGNVEAATGITLFMDSAIRALPASNGCRRLLLADGTAHEAAKRLRQEGWSTVACFEPTGDLAREARRLRCGHVFENGEIVAIDGTKRS